MPGTILYILMLGTLLFSNPLFSGLNALNRPLAERMEASDKPDLNKVIFQDKFAYLDTLNWKVEIDPQPFSSVYVRDNKLVLDTKGGVTVWLNKELSGDFQIEYKRKVVVEQGKNDRLSDMNQFWMATDPRNPDLFTRSGKFEEYDLLMMYYAGIGGNWNTTTRFRKYHGDNNRELVKEYTDAPHLLEANKEYTIKIIVNGKTTSLWVDDRCYFEYQDADFLNTGYFGFRSTFSRQEISDFRVSRLTN